MRKNKFPVVVFVLLVMLLLTAAVLPPILVFSCGGESGDNGDNPLPPAPVVRPEYTDKFEAEYARLKAMNPQLDGSDSFVERSDTASNGLHIAYFGAKGNTVTFEINANAADPDATLYISLVSFWDDFEKKHVETDFDSVWELYVNGDLVKVNKKFLSPNDNNAYHDFVEVSVKVGLKEGANVIKMLCPHTGDGQYGLNTDYIRFETAATLSWYPYKENKIRPSD